MLKHLAIFLISISILVGCSFAPPAGHLIKVSRARYVPQLDQAQLSDYSGKLLNVQSIQASQNTNFTNFYYLSEDKSVGYTLYYSSGSMQQPVVSFFWYAFEKAFDSIGMKIGATSLVKNVPDLNLKIMSLTDEQAVFQLSLLRNGVLLIQKELEVFQKLKPTDDYGELEKRQYAFIDLMATSILNDPDFKDAFFSDQAMID